MYFRARLATRSKLSDDVNKLRISETACIAVPDTKPRPFSRITLLGSTLRLTTGVPAAQASRKDVGKPSVSGVDRSAAAFEIISKVRLGATCPRYSPFGRDRNSFTIRSPYPGG